MPRRFFYVLISLAVWALAASDVPAAYSEKSDTCRLVVDSEAGISITLKEAPQHTGKCWGSDIAWLVLRFPLAPAFADLLGPSTAGVWVTDLPGQNFSQAHKQGTNQNFLVILSKQGGMNAALIATSKTVGNQTILFSILSGKEGTKDGKPTLEYKARVTVPQKGSFLARSFTVSGNIAKAFNTQWASYGYPPPPPPPVHRGRSSSGKKFQSTITRLQDGFRSYPSLTRS